MNEKLKIGILDDEESPRILLTEIIESIPGYQIAFSTSDPFKALEWAQNHQCEILITDIMIPGFSGLELSRQLIHINIPIIICSAYDKFGVESFKVNAVYFILKPPSFFEVSHALDKAKAALKKNTTHENFPFNDLVLIKRAGDLEQALIRPSDIRYLEQKGDYTLIYLDSGEEIRSRNPFYISLEKVGRPYILRVHRSFAINYLKIKSLDQSSCHFERGVKVPIGKDYRQNFFDFLQGKTIV